MCVVCVSGVRMLHLKRKPIDGELLLTDDVCNAVYDPSLTQTDWKKVLEHLFQNAKQWNRDDVHPKLRFLDGSLKSEIVLKPWRENRRVCQIVIDNEPKACIDFRRNSHGLEQFELLQRVYAKADGKGVVEPFHLLWNEAQNVGAVVTAGYGPSLADVSSNEELKGRFCKNVGGYFAEIPSCLEALSQLNIDADHTLKSAANFVECDGVWKVSNFWETFLTPGKSSNNVSSICILVRDHLLPLFAKTFVAQLTSSLINKKLAQSTSPGQTGPDLAFFDQVMFGLVLLNRGLTNADIRKFVKEVMEDPKQTELRKQLPIELRQNRFRLFDKTNGVLTEFGEWICKKIMEMLYGH